MAALWILLGMIALFWLLLALPLRISLHYAPDDGFSYRVNYLFFTLADSREEAPQEAAAAPKLPPKSDRRAVKKLLSFLGLEELSSAASFQRAKRERGTMQTLSDIGAAVRRLLSQTFSLLRKGKFRRFALHIRVGDADPADAALNYGTICATVYPLVTLLDRRISRRHRTVDLRCDYTLAQTDVRFDGLVCYRPWHFVCYLFHLLGNYLKKEKKQDEPAS